MKKLVSIFLAVMLCMAFSASALAAPTVILDGQELTFDVPPIIEDGRTLVPLRAVFEAMGAEVSWDQETRTAIGVRGDTTVCLPIGSTEPTINGVVYELDVPGKIVDGRTLAPLRFVGEAFGGEVGWNGATQTITMCSNAAPLSITATVEQFLSAAETDYFSSLAYCYYEDEAAPNQEDMLPEMAESINDAIGDISWEIVSSVMLNCEEANVTVVITANNAVETQITMTLSKIDGIWLIEGNAEVTDAIFGIAPGGNFQDAFQ